MRSRRRGERGRGRSTRDGGGEADGGEEEEDKKRERDGIRERRKEESTEVE
jgi:hypothetical protein